MSDKVDDALKIFCHVRYELECLLIKVVQELAVKHHAVKTKHDCNVAITEILSSVGGNTLKEITSFRLPFNKEKLFQPSSWKPLASIDIDTFDSSLIFDILLRFKTFLDLTGNYGWCISACAPCCPNCDHSDSNRCIQCRNNRGQPSNKCNHMCKHCKFQEKKFCSKECCNKCKTSYVINQKQYDILIENKVKRQVVDVSHIKVCYLFAFMQGLDIASKFRNMCCHLNKNVLTGFLDPAKQSQLGELADISDMKELELLLSTAFQHICKFVNIPDAPFLKNLHDIFEYKETFEEYFRKNNKKVQKMVEKESFLKLGLCMAEEHKETRDITRNDNAEEHKKTKDIVRNDIAEEHKKTKEIVRHDIAEEHKKTKEIIRHDISEEHKETRDIVRNLEKRFAEFSGNATQRYLPSGSEANESVQEYEFELEKKYEGGCLLSFCDVNIDVSTNQIEFKLYRLDEDDKNKSPVYRTLVENKDFRIEDDSGILYAHIKNCLKSGYKYSFLMEGITSDGVDVNIVYKDLEAIDEGDCSYIDTKEEIIFLSHNSGVSNNIQLFEIINPITDNTRCKPIRKGLKKADTVVKFRELAEEYYSDNSYLQRFPPGYYVRDDDLRKFGDLLESFQVVPPKHFFRILTGYNPVDHLKVFGYNKKQLEDIGINEDVENKFSNSVIVVNSKESLVFVGVVSRKTEDLKTTMEQCNVMLKAIYILNQSYLSGTYVAVIGAVVLPDVDRNELTKDKFKFLNVDDAVDLKKEGILFITEENLKSKETLEQWWTSAREQICTLRLDLVGKDQHYIEELKKTAGQMMTVMALVDNHLPKVTKNIADKICTLLLNVEQMKAIQDPSNKKVLLGPFGSGKSLVLKEIARTLFEREESGIVYYICFDPYSLLEIEVENYFKKLQRKTESNVELKTLNIKDAAQENGFKLDELYDLCGVPTKNIGDLLVRLVENGSLKVHFLIDEFHSDSADEAYCNHLGSILQKQLKDSKVAVAVQSVEKCRKIYDDGAEHEIKNCSLKQSGMEPIVLSKCMRVATNLYQLIEVAQNCIKRMTTSIVLEVKQAKSEKKEPLPQKTNTGPDESDVEVRETDNTIRTNSTVKIKGSIYLHEKKPDYAGTDVDFSKFHEPEMIPGQFPKMLPVDEKEEVLKSLTSKVQFQDGVCGIKIPSSHQPQLIFLDDAFSTTQVLSGKLLALVIEHLCLENQHRTTIICNLLEEAILTKFALSFIQGRSCILYTPYLQNKCPSKEEKRKVWNEMESPGSVLLTDYRGFRGCETDHCICFVSPHEQYANHVLVEILARAVAKIDVLVLPKKQDGNNQGSLGQVIKEWQKAWQEKPLQNKRLVRESIVKLNGESLIASLNEDKFKIEILPKDQPLWKEVNDSFQIIKNQDAMKRHLKKTTSRFSKRFELEKKYKGGCLLSFCDVDIDVSTNQIEFKLCRLDEFDMTRSPVYRTLVENTEYRIEKDCGVLYAHIANCLDSGYKYSFLMEGRTSNGMNVNITYKDLRAIDEIDCRYINIKEKIIFLAHNNGVSNNIHLFDINKPITGNTRCKPILKSPKPAVTVGEFRELAEKYYSDNSYLQRFPPGYYVRDDDLRKFGDLLESFQVVPPKHFFRILTGYNPVDHLKVFGYNKKQLEDIGINEDVENKFSNSVVVVNSKESLVFVGVVSRKTEDLKTTMEQCNVMLKAIYILNQCYLSGTYIAVVGAVVLPNVNRNQLTKENFKFLNVDDAIDLDNEGILFITKEDLHSEQNLKTWWTSALQQIYQTRRTHASKEQHDLAPVLKQIAGQMMGVNALVHVQLPKVTKNIADKIDTLFLSKEQLEATGVTLDVIKEMR